MPTLHPYLHFNGNTEDVFNFYRSVFGGEFSLLSRNKDIPADTQNPTDPSEADKILHVSLPIGKNTVLMGSDRPSKFGPATFGDNIMISISVDSEEEATKLFNGLSAGGSVLMPLGKTFWGAFFGMLKDKFGIQWMVSYDYK
jgi:PhnB protein